MTRVRCMVGGRGGRDGCEHTGKRLISLIPCTCHTIHTALFHDFSSLQNPSNDLRPSLLALCISYNSLNCLNELLKQPVIYTQLEDHWCVGPSQTCVIL